MVCNGICDFFVIHLMVLEFSVMVLLYFSADSPHCFIYNAFYVILKTVVGLDLFL